MKKIGILTINGTDNYGNRLQNFALEYRLEKEGCSVVTIKNLNGISNAGILRILVREIRKIKQKYVHGIANKARKENFKKFDENIKYTLKSYDRRSLKEISKLKCDKYVIGSDQVWNPYFKRMSKIDFALFASCENVISYAASFGINKIPKSKWKFYIKGLNNISKISVREEKGAEIVKELTGRDAEVVLDPTLLLSQEEWKNVMKKPKNIPNKKYILTYFLGNISNENMKKIEKIAECNNFEIVNLGDLKYSQYYIAGPSEFLWYCCNAEIIFTDSFHGCVFSIIFDKTFYYMERNDKSFSMNSRIDTLLSKLELEDRVLVNWNYVCLQHDYIRARKMLKLEQKKSLIFLRNALEINEELLK